MLKGIGLEGPKGLITQLQNGDFIPSPVSQAFSKTLESNFFKLKVEKAAPVMSKEEFSTARRNGISKEAGAYLQKRDIPDYVYRDFDLNIFSATTGMQFEFMKQPLKETAIFFPVFSDEGEVVHVHYNLINNGGYYMSPGTKPIYLTKATAMYTIVVVEGIFDALSVGGRERFV